jgi:hypothetical protein
MNTNLADAPDFIGICRHRDKVDLSEWLAASIGNPAACPAT